MSLPLAEYTQLLGAYLKPLRGRVSRLAALALAGIGLQLLNPQVIRYFIDTAQTAGPAHGLLLAAAAYLGIGLAERGISFATTYVSLQVGWAATDALRGDLARHVLSNVKSARGCSRSTKSSSSCSWGRVRVMGACCLALDDQRLPYNHACVVIPTDP